MWDSHPHSRSFPYEIITSFLDAYIFLSLFMICFPFVLDCLHSNFLLQYQRAISQALIDRVPDEKASVITTVYSLTLSLSLSSFCWYCSIFYFFCSACCYVYDEVNCYSYIFAKVLMVVGAGRGPLVRASLQVVLLTILFTHIP